MMGNGKKRFERVDGLAALLDDEDALRCFVSDMNQKGREVRKKEKAKRDLIIAPDGLSPDEQANFIVNELFRLYSKRPDVFIPKD